LLEDSTELGKGEIGPDGKFEFEVPALETGQRVGILLDDLTGTQWTAEELETPAFVGPGSFNNPQFGFFLDTVLVQ
jgi:hypothetical protein